MNVSRRSLMKAALASGAFATVESPSQGERASAATTLEPIVVALSWVPNVEYAGLWIADSAGYLRAEGLALKTISGGPNATPAPVAVAAGQADVGYATWLPFLDAIQRGNDFVGLGATFPISPVGILSLPSRPIKTAQDIVGAKILASGPNERAAIEATLAVNGLPKDYKPIPAGFSPEPLLQRAADGYAGYATNEVLTFERMGLKRDKDFFFLSLDSIGFKAAASILFSTRAALAKDRSKYVGLMKALIHGWNDEKSDPALGAHLAVEKYGVDLGLDLGQQIEQAKAQTILLVDPSYPHLPPLTLDLAKISGPMYDTARAAGRINLPDPARLFDFSVIADAIKS